jgi:serine/threonine-protein kinase
MMTDEAATESDTESSRRDAWSAPCAAGDVVEGKYRVGELLGSGGMAWVFRATHIALGQQVALKVLRVDPSADNSRLVARFRQEARAAARIAGTATAHVVDVGTLADGSPYLVMECLEGRSLDKVLGWGGGRMPISLVVDYVLQACEGVAEAHAAGIVHRDLKPSNLFLAQTSDGTARLKLIDFGVSKFVEPSPDTTRLTSTRELVGSPVYMAPEQMRTGRRVDRRADIWSLGVVLYEMLAQGHLPFDAPTLPQICARVLEERPPPLGSIRPSVPRGLEAVVIRCLEKEPAKRYQTVADLADALVSFAPDLDRARDRAERVRRILTGVASERPYHRGPAPRRSSTRRILHVGGGLALCGLLAASAALSLRPSDVQAAAVTASESFGQEGGVTPVDPGGSPAVIEAARLLPLPRVTAQSAVEPPSSAESPSGGVARPKQAKVMREGSLAKRAPSVSASAAAALLPAPASVHGTTGGLPTIGPPAVFKVAEFGGRE